MIHIHHESETSASPITTWPDEITKSRGIGIMSPDYPRITQLAGAVIRHVAAAIHLVQLDALRLEQFIARQHVLAPGIAPQRQNRRMLQHQQRVADLAGLARSNDPLLDGKAFGVGDAT